MEKHIELGEGEEILLRFRPAWRSFWVFILGLLLVGVGPFLRENPPLSIEFGLFLAVVFALLILRRWSDVYVLTNFRVIVRGGLIYRDNNEIIWSDVMNVEAFQGFNLRLVKAGHILIRSRNPHQENIMMYGQPNPDQLKTKMEELAYAAQAGRDS